MKIIRLIWLSILLTLLSSVALAQDTSAVKEESEKFIEALSNIPEWIKPPAFRYDPKGKVDPFVPFINKVNERLTAKKRKKGTLSPLERVDVTQLKVIGILWEPENPNQARAMVELPDGKGFLLEKGMVVGRNEGKVVKITPDTIIVEEEVANIFGEVEKKKVVLKLHPKKGEE